MPVYEGQLARSHEVEAPSNDALKAVIEQRIATGELLSLEVETTGISSLAGKYEADPTLRAICDEAYQLRDAERSA